MDFMRETMPRLRPTGNVSKEERALILSRWDTARDEYRRECAAITRVRMSLPPRDMRSRDQIVLWELASQRYKLACQKYAKERELMVAELYHDKNAEAVQGIVDQLVAAMKGIPISSVPTAAEIKKLDTLRDDLITTGAFDEIRQAALQHQLAPALGVADEPVGFRTPPDALAFNPPPTTAVTEECEHGVPLLEQCSVCDIDKE